MRTISHAAIPHYVWSRQVCLTLSTSFVKTHHPMQVPRCIRQLFSPKPPVSESRHKMAALADTSSTTLRALSNIISSGIQTLESAYSNKGISFPTLSDTFEPGPLDTDPAVNETTRTIVAAAYQIIATVRAPPESIQEYATGAYSTAALNLVVDLNIPNILQEAGARVRGCCSYESLRNLITTGSTRKRYLPED